MLSKKDLFNITLLILVTIIFFWPAFTNPTELISAGDFLRESVGSMEFMHNNYQEFGERPLWNHQILAGKPQITDIEHSPYYITGLLAPYFFEYYFANFIVIFHFFLAGLFMYLLLRVLKLKRSSATIGAIAYMLGRNLLNLVYGGDFLPVISYAFTPLVFLSFEKLLQKRNLKWTLIFSAIVSVKFFIGRVQFFYYTILALAIYAIVRLYQLRKENPQVITSTIKYIALASIIFLGVTAIQLLPLIEVMPHTLQTQDAEVASYEFSAKESVPFKHFATLFVPTLFGKRADNSYWGAPSRLIDMYLGILPLLLALIAIVFVKNKYKTPLVILAGFSTLFALGQYTPFFRIMYELIPGVSLFKVPGRMLTIFTFAMATLAAFGAEHFLTKKMPLEKLKKPAIAILTLSIAGSIGSYILKPAILNYGEKLLNQYYYVKYAGTNLVANYSFEYLSTKLIVAFNHIAIGFVILTTLLILSYIAIFKTTKLRKKTTAGIIIGIILLDLLLLTNVYDWNQIKELSYPGTLKSSTTLEEWDALAREIKTMDNSTYRVMGFPIETLMRNNLQSVEGVDSMAIAYLSEYFESKYQSNMIGLTNVKYLLTQNELPLENFKLIDENLIHSHYIFGANKSFNLYENKNWMPRAFVVPNARTVELEQQLEIIKNWEFDPKKEVLTIEEISLEGGQEFKEVNIDFYSPNKVKLSVSTEKPGFLVISDTYYPGWKAYVNRDETKIYRANYIMRSVYLPAGENQIEFVYDPLSYKIGKWITIITLSIIGILALLLIIFRKST
ncbi:MAG: YfhO family protein [archaeon]